MKFARCEGKSTLRVAAVLKELGLSDQEVAEICFATGLIQVGGETAGGVFKRLFQRIKASREVFGAQ